MIGMASLFCTALRKRKPTAKQLQTRYPAAALDALVNPLSYRVIEALSFVAGEAVAAPTELAVLCRISCAKSTFDMMANWLGKNKPRPDTAAAEVENTSFTVGQDGTIRAVYSMLIDSKAKVTQKVPSGPHSLFSNRI